MTPYLSEVVGVGLIFDDWFAFPLGRVSPFGNRLKKLSGLGRDQGNLLKGIDKKTVRRVGVSICLPISNSQLCF
jgi:hypothetical protein